MNEYFDIIAAGINGDQLPDHISSYIQDPLCRISCSKAHLGIIENQFPEFQQERWIPIIPLDDCFETVSACLKQQTVLFIISGDPLFYGLGKRLAQNFPDAEIKFIPAVSYMQSCFAHIGVNWDDSEFISLHGRPISSLDRKLNCGKLFIFTDPTNSPDVIARYWKSKITGDYSGHTVYVGERIGTDNERFVSGTFDEIETMSFAQPNSMVVVDSSGRSERYPVRFGLGEDDIEHSRGLITKNEVRAAVIHRLQLFEHAVLWDIGAGSGSVGLEAARAFPALTVYAVEQNEEQLANIRANKEFFGCSNLHIVNGQAPEILSGLPQPDRVFIGGSGGRLEDIIDVAVSVLKKKGRIVATAVIESTARIVPEKLYARGFEVEISVIETVRYRYPETEETRFNPISIICGTPS